MKKSSKGETHFVRDRQTDRQTDTDRDRQTDRQTNRQRHTEIERERDGMPRMVLLKPGTQSVSFFYMHRSERFLYENSK